MKQWFYRTMAGRYGADQLGRAISLIALVCMVIGIFTFRWLNTVALALLLLCYFRMFSRNVPRRMAENQRYLALRWQLLQRLSGVRTRFAQRKAYRFFRCPSCGQRVRVPRGRGKIQITCPKCRGEFIKKS